jgi:hypothetical protein
MVIFFPVSPFEIVEENIVFSRGSGEAFFYPFVTGVVRNLNMYSETCE